MEGKTLQISGPERNTFSHHQKLANASYYFLCVLACIAYAISIFWIVMDFLFNMPGKFSYVLLGMICGTLFLKIAKNLR